MRSRRSPAVGAAVTLLLAAPALLIAAPANAADNARAVTAAASPASAASAPAASAPAASEIVLLTNNGILPLVSAAASHVVITADLPGSSTVTHDAVSSAVSKLLGESTTEMSVGVAVPAGIPGGQPITPTMLTARDGAPGVTAERFAAGDFSGTPNVETVQSTVIASPEGSDAIRLSGQLAVPADGSYDFMISGTGHASLSINGVRYAESNAPPAAIDGSVPLVARDFAGRAYGSATVTLELTAGDTIDLTVEHSDAVTASPVVSLSWRPPQAVTSPEVAAAVESARASDVAVIVVPELRSGDSADPVAEPAKLPVDHAELIAQVVAANPNTVVVLDAASDSALTSWVDLPAAVLYVPTGVAELETIASVLLGQSEPTGSLQTSLPPPAPDGQVGVQPDTTVAPPTPPRFEPGHGLRYWGWQLSELTVAMQSPATQPGTGPPGVDASVLVTVTATGTSAGTANVELSASRAGSEEYVAAGEISIALAPTVSTTVSAPLDLTHLDLASADAWPLTIRARTAQSTVSTLLERPTSPPVTPTNGRRSPPPVPRVHDTVTVADGLTLSINGAAAVLGNAEVRGSYVRLTGTLPTITVLDTRDYASGSGWTVAARASDLVSADGRISAEELGWVPRLEASGGGVLVGPTVAPRLSGGPGLAKSAVLGHSAGPTTGHRIDFTAGLVLETPTTAAPGRYSGTLTVTLFPDE